MTDAAGSETAAFIVLQRAAARLLEGVAAVVKPHGLSTPQYNVLRILRGAHPEPIACGEIGDRMLSPFPDVTRLVDRIEHAGWASRCRGTADRRVVRVSITPAGLALLAALDAPIDDLHRRQFAPLSPRRTAQLSAWLDSLVES